MATSSPPPVSAPASAPASPAVTATPVSSPSVTATASPSTAAAQTGANTFLAAGQDTNGTPLHEPACGGFGCALSGDSTAFLYKMTWTTWSATQAIGTGTYKLDSCNPNCAAGTVYPVPTTVTLSQPVKVCSSSGARWYWSYASFRFPDGLPKALQGQNAPQNPWTFSSVVTAAQASCGSLPGGLSRGPWWRPVCRWSRPL
ncbi:MAG: hypothetical protein ACRDOB_09895 [Streptosporangiaceae bacterium]